MPVATMTATAPQTATFQGIDRNVSVELVRASAHDSVSMCQCRSWTHVFGSISFAHFFQQAVCQSCLVACQPPGAVRGPSYPRVHSASYLRWRTEYFTPHGRLLTACLFAHRAGSCIQIGFENGLGRRKGPRKGQQRYSEAHLDQKAKRSSGPWRRGWQRLGRAFDSNKHIQLPAFEACRHHK